MAFSAENQIWGKQNDSPNQVIGKLCFLFYASAHFLDRLYGNSICKTTSFICCFVNEPPHDKTNKMASDQSLRCPHKESLGP